MKRLKFISICSGIEAASVAFPDWEAIAFSEIDNFCNEFLAFKYPNVPNLGDMTAVNWKRWKGKANIVVSGTPCQAFSVSGNRQSLKDARGNLTLEFVKACDAIKPGIILWENVPGVLSTPDNAFGCLLGGLVGAADALIPPKQLKQYRSEKGDVKWSNSGMVVGAKRSVAWRVLDAQHFGLPQRRKRVFLLAFDFRDSYRLFGTSSRKNLRGLAGIPGAILFEPENVQRHSPQSGHPQEDSSRSTTASVRGTGRNHLPTDSRDGTCGGADRARGDLAKSTSIPTDSGRLSVYRSIQFGGYGEGFGTLCALDHKRVANIVVVKIDNTSSCGSGILEDGTTHTLGGATDAIAYNLTFCDANGSRKDRPNGGLYVRETDKANTLVAHPKLETVLVIKDTSNLFQATQKGGIDSNLAFTLDTRGKGGCVDSRNSFIIRRFTPTECLRLQGFSDDYLDFAYRGKPIVPDTCKYQAIGNSWSVPTVRWIGNRINKVLDEVSKSLSS